MDLASKINEQFLTCHLCWRLYTEPKCLNCLHTFCKKCIESQIMSQRAYRYADYKEVSCPICRKKTNIPTGGANRLPDNFVLSGLREMILDKVSKTKVEYCQFCRGETDERTNSATDDPSIVQNEKSEENPTDVHNRARATLKCVECQKPICEKCAVEHQSTAISANHNFYELELEKDVLCRSHPGDPVRYFCETCETCVCIICACGPDHRDHVLSDFKAAVVERKATLVKELNTCQDKLNVVQSQLEIIDKCEKHVDQVRTDITKQSELLIQSIQLGESRCLSSLEHGISFYFSRMRFHEVDNAFGESIMMISERRPQLEQLNEQLRNTCSLVDLMLQGREIELLLMLNRLSEKMRSITSVEVLCLDQHDRLENARFIPGAVDFGTLAFDDAKHPTEEKLCVDSAVQTDECIVLETVTESSKITEIPDVNFSRASSPPSDTCADTNDLLPRLTKKVRRILKRNCTLAVLPNSDIIVLDPETNSMSILDKRGKIKYFVSNTSKNNAHTGNESGNCASSTAKATPTYVGVGGFNDISISDAIEKVVSLQTPQGNVLIKLENETSNALPVGFTAHAFNCMSLETSNTQKKNERQKHRFDLFQST